jgi:hypothetical protein
MGQIDSHLQEGTFMTRAELQTNQEYMWQALFGEQLTTLTLAVEMLLRCHLSPEEILKNNNGSGRLAARCLRIPSDDDS